MHMYPAKIAAAFEVLEWGDNLCLIEQLHPREKAIYNAALEVLRLYLSGEMEFSNSAPVEKSKGRNVCFFCNALENPDNIV